MSRRRWWQVATANEEDFGEQLLYLAHLNDLANWGDFVAAEGALPVNALFLAAEAPPRPEDVTYLVLTIVVVCSFLYLGLFVWALFDAGRMERTGWQLGIWLGGPVALIAWLVYGRRQD